MSDHDYTEHAVRPTEDAFAKLGELLRERGRAEIAIAAATLALKEATDQYEDVAHVRLPEQMRAMGVRECVTTGGLKFALKETTYANLPKKDLRRFQQGVAWLMDNGHDGIVKREVRANVGTDAELTLAAIAALKQAGVEIVKETINVNAQSLSAVVRELEREGSHVPRELFGVWDKVEVVVK